MISLFQHFRQYIQYVAACNTIAKALTMEPTSERPIFARLLDGPLAGALIFRSTTISEFLRIPEVTFQGLKVYTYRRLPPQFDEGDESKFIQV